MTRKGTTSRSKYAYYGTILTQLQQRDYTTVQLLQYFKKKDKMLLKRKRSDIDLIPATSPFSATSNSSSNRDLSQSPTLVYSTFASNTTSSWPQIPSDALRACLHSRTRKRYRDNRPEQEIVHGKPEAPVQQNDCILISPS